MGRPRNRIGWPYDPIREEFTLPDGRKLTLRDIAQRIQDDVMCRWDFAGPWSGWSIRQQYLRGPGGVRLTSRTAQQFWRWVNASPRIADVIEQARITSPGKRVKTAVSVAVEMDHVPLYFTGH